MKVPAHVYAFALAALCIGGAIVLTAMSKAVPSELWQAAFLTVGAGAGIAIPSGGSTPTPPTA